MVSGVRFSDGSPLKSTRTGCFFNGVFISEENRTTKSMSSGLPKAERDGHKIELICEANVGKVTPCRFSDGSPPKRTCYCKSFLNDVCLRQKMLASPMMLLRNDVCFAHFKANIISFLSVAKIHHFGFADTSLVSTANDIIIHPSRVFF